MPATFSRVAGVPPINFKILLLEARAAQYPIKNRTRGDLWQINRDKVLPLPIRRIRRIRRDRRIRQSPRDQGRWDEPQMVARLARPVCL
jgi:hypothetical protein